MFYQRIFLSVLSPSYGNFDAYNWRVEFMHLHVTSVLDGTEGLNVASVRNWINIAVDI